MIPRPLAGAAVLGALAALALPAPARSGEKKKAKYSIKVVTEAPPKDLQGAVRKELGDRCVQLYDGRDNLLAEVWFRKEVPVKATEAQFKNGLTYREVPQSTVIGALRVPRPITDYRKQRVPAGTYTLRLAAQPMDGDHMGTAPYADFLLASPAADDKSPGLLATKAMHELSAKTTDAHPSVWLLFPGKGAGAAPTLVNKGMGHWVLLVSLDAASGGVKGKLLLGLTLVGVSSSA